MRVGRGKIIKIAKNGVDLMAGLSPLTLDSELSLSLKSNFAPIIGSSANKLLTIASNLAKSTGLTTIGITGAFKEMGFQLWSGTEPLSFSFDTTLNMKSSALKDVLQPAQLLMKIPLPTDGDADRGEIGLVAPGPSIMQAFANDRDATNRDVRNFNHFSIRIGPIYISSIIIESVEPTWAMETDEDGIPIWCKLKIDVKSIFTATTQMIDEFGYSNTASNTNRLLDYSNNQV